MVSTIQLGVRGDIARRSVAEAAIVEMLLLGGWAYELAAGQRRLAAEHCLAALKLWIDKGLEFASDSDGHRRYDPAEVMNFMKWTSLNGSDDFWTERFVPTGRRFVTDNLGGDAADAPRDRGFGVGFARRFNLAGRATARPLRLRVPVPLEDSQLRLLEVRSDSCLQRSLADGRLGMPLAARAAGENLIAYRAEFVACPKTSLAAEPLGADDKALFLRPKDGLVSVSTRVAHLARRIAARTADRRIALEALWNWTLDSMLIGVIHYDEIDWSLPMDWTLENRWMDCQLGSALLVSLCRALSIPARIVGGTLLYPLAPTHHFWMEAWLDESGWVPFDLLSWDLSAGGRDAAWRNHFAGKLDHRMKTQCFPHRITGPVGVKMPDRWFILTQSLNEGIRITLNDADSGAFVYEDEISVYPSMVNAGPLEP